MATAQTVAFSVPFGYIGMAYTVMATAQTVAFSVSFRYIGMAYTLAVMATAVKLELGPAGAGSAGFGLVPNGWQVVSAGSCVCVVCA